MYAPTGLFLLAAVWVAIVAVGYTGMFWAIEEPTWRDAFSASGSSLLTLGFRAPLDIPATALTFSEATIGLLLVALLVAYLPTMYAAFSKREAAVTKLEVRAGNPPTPMRIIAMYHTLGEQERLAELWEDWENWFIELEESHTSLAALNFFRSPQPHRHWVVAAATILDAAALQASVVDGKRVPQAELCIRAGFLALRRVAAYFTVSFNPDPHFPAAGINVSRAQFEAAYDGLSASGVPLNPDREAAWFAFAGWRVNYDSVLIALATITLAPDAPWLPARFEGGSRIPLTRIS